jgi:hypothetical protein
VATWAEHVDLSRQANPGSELWSALPGSLPARTSSCCSSPDAAGVVANAALTSEIERLPTAIRHMWPELLAHAPPHPPNEPPTSGTAASLTVVPAGQEISQLLEAVPHLAFDRPTPRTEPAPPTTTRTSLRLRLKTARAEVAEASDRTHTTALPRQAPAQ